MANNKDSNTHGLRMQSFICCCFLDLLALSSNYGSRGLYCMSATLFTYTGRITVKAAVNNSLVNHHELHSSPAHKDKLQTFTLIILIAIKSTKHIIVADVDIVIKYKSKCCDCVAIFLTFIVSVNTF